MPGRRADLLASAAAVGLSALVAEGGLGAGGPRAGAETVGADGAQRARRVRGPEGLVLSKPWYTSARRLMTIADFSCISLQRYPVRSVC